MLVEVSREGGGRTTGHRGIATLPTRRKWYSWWCKYQKVVLWAEADHCRLSLLKGTSAQGSHHMDYKSPSMHPSPKRKTDRLLINSQNKLSKDGWSEAVQAKMNILHTAQIPMIGGMLPFRCFRPNPFHIHLSKKKPSALMGGLHCRQPVLVRRLAEDNTIAWLEERFACGQYRPTTKCVQITNG